MTFQQIAMFLEVAKRLNITAVAEEMYVSQAALSKMIQRLEDSLEMPLFERGRRGLKLTPQGKLLYNKIRAPFESICNSIAEVQSLSADKPLSIRIGYLTTIDMNSDYDRLNNYIQKYKAQNPQIVFQEGLYSFDELRSKLKYGDLDLIFIPSFELYNSDDIAVESKAVLRYQIFIAVGENNPVIKGNSINVNALNKQPLYAIGKSRSDTMEDYLKNAVGYDLRDDSRIDLPNADTLFRSLKSGYGFAILGRLKSGEKEGIKLFPVSDIPWTLTLHMAWKGNNDNMFLHQFIKSISDNIEY